MTVIEAGSEETWPDRMLKALSDCAENLAAYHAKRAKIDRAAERDVILRINRPVNPFQEVWDDVLRISQHAISRKRLLGFHATRLTDTERRDIGLNGLRVPSPELLARRLQAALSEGILSDVHLAALRSRNQVGDANRRDRMSFCFSRGLLQDEGGMKRLFSSWGGEALYRSHENDEVRASPGSHRSALHCCCSRAN